MNRSYLHLQSLTIIGFILFFSGCKKEVFDTVPPVTDVCDSLNYQDHTKQIIDTKCATPSCHAQGGGAPGDFSNLENIRVNKDKIVDRVFVKGDMPPSGSPGLSSAEMDVLKDWLECGAKGTATAPQPQDTTGNNSNNGGDTTSTTTISYKNDVAPIVVNKCGGCHGTNGSGGLSNVTQYSVLKTIIDNGKFEDRVFVKKDMPPGGPLPQGEIDKIRKWITNGAKDD